MQIWNTTREWINKSRRARVDDRGSECKQQKLGHFVSYDQTMSDFGRSNVGEALLFGWIGFRRGMLRGEVPEWIENRYSMFTWTAYCDSFSMRAKKWSVNVFEKAEGGTKNSEDVFRRDGLNSFIRLTRGSLWGVYELAFSRSAANCFLFRSHQLLSPSV